MPSDGRVLGMKGRRGKGRLLGLRRSHFAKRRGESVSDVLFLIAKRLLPIDLDEARTHRRYKVARETMIAGSPEERLGFAELISMTVRAPLPSNCGTNKVRSFVPFRSEYRGGPDGTSGNEALAREGRWAI